MGGAARPPGRRRVLVVVQGELGDRPAGPQIRGWEIARAFARRHDVTVAATTDAPHVRDGLPVVPRTRGSLVAQARRHDVLVGPVLPPYALAAAAGRRAVRVADLYDPVELEVGTLEAGWATGRARARQRALRRLQLRFADVVVCANGRQRTRALADLRAHGFAGPPPRLVTVPMGLAAARPPAPGDRPLRARFGFGAGDPVVLWWGTVWRWLDAETAIRAVDRLRRTLPGVRLVITAGPPPDRRTDRLDGTAAARALAERLGLLGSHVFLLDEWVPYEERGRYLGDADVGITLHADGEEAPLAARSRYADYLGAGLPSVLARGDELADELAAAGAARLVPPGDVEAAAAALERLLADPAACERARRGCRDLAARYRWAAVTEPLVATVEGTPPQAGHPLAVAGAGARYYGRRAVDRVGGAG